MSENVESKARIPCSLPFGEFLWNGLKPLIAGYIISAYWRLKFIPKYDDKFFNNLFNDKYPAIIDF